MVQMLRLLTDGQVPFWPRYPAFQPANTHSWSIREESGKAQQESLKTEGNCFDFVGSLFFFISRGFMLSIIISATQLQNYQKSLVNIAVF